MNHLNDVVSSVVLSRRLDDESGGNHAPLPKSASLNAKYKAVFISDVHLGTKDCKAKHLAEFLKANSCETLYLVGDIFDGWRMRRGVYWNKSFNKVVRRVLKIAKQGTSVYYITGNHDEFLRRYASASFDNIKLVNRCTHIGKNGNRYLVIHGDQFEGVTHCSKILKYIGDVGYELLMGLNRLFNKLRAQAGFGFWSFAAFLKRKIKRAKKYIDDYECAVAKGARIQGYDGVVCGHIHHANIREIEGTLYLNTGDWVESCTSIVETHEGEFKLVEWLRSDDYLALKRKKHDKREKSQKRHIKKALLQAALD